MKVARCVSVYFFISYVLFMGVCYSYFFYKIKKEIGDDVTYISTDAGYTPPFSGRLTRLRRSEYIFSIGFDKIFSQNLFNKLNIINWGVNPIHFGVCKEKEFYYWSFRKGGFIHVEDIKNSSNIYFQDIPIICKFHKIK